MDHPAHNGLKHRPWDRLPAAERAPFLREAREYVKADIYREDPPDVSPDEFEEAVRQAAEEIYAEACERRTRERASEVPRAGLPRGPGPRLSI